MNKSTSECSSGCESGWTMYLDQSTNSALNVDQDCERNRGENNVDDNDSSMVSDASSGPPNFHQDGECFLSASEKTKKAKQKKKIKENRGKQFNSYLDDTASSPVFSFSHNNVALSNNQDSLEHDTQQGKSALNKHFGFLKPSGKAASEKSGRLQGR